MGATRRILAAVALVAGMTAGAVGLAQFAHGDEPTISADQQRDGWDPNEPNLSPAVVGSGTFGRLFSTAVNGQIYAQPLAVGGSVIVATENDWVYSLNAETGAINWSLPLGRPWASTVVGCEDITPNVGVTSTPVYDPSTGTVYVVAELNNAANAYAPSVDLFAVNAASGTVDWEVPVQGAPVNEPTRPFDPLTERQRASLLLLDGTVYMGFASYCDFQPYVGYVAGVNTATHALTMWTDESGTTDSQAGIWQAGGGLMSDGTGRIFTATGNGVSPAAGPGTSPPGELGDSVVRLGVQQQGGSLAAQDFFSPANAPVLAARDKDFGSGGPVALPFGTSAHPQLLMQAGKDGRIFLLDRNSLGGRGSTADHPVSVTPIAYAGQGGHPAAFAGSGGADYLYYHGGSDFTHAFKFNTANAALTDAGHTPDTFHGGSGSPVVTSNGTDPASAVVWEVNRGASATSGTLEAFDAIPNASGQLRMVWSAPIGTATKFSVPATDSGRVYVGTLDGHVIGFGSPDTAPLSGPPLAFNELAVGSSSCRTATIKATTVPVTVTGVTASSSAATDPFTVNQNGCAAPPVTFPQTLTTAGQTLTVPVTFAPTAPGGATGALAFATSTHDFSTVDVSVSGIGTQTGFFASPASLQFGTVPTGSSGSRQIVITNGGTAAETVTSTTAPTGPFSASGLPAKGTSIKPGGSVTVTVAFKPTAATGDTGSLSVAGSLGGTAATVSLGGTGTAGQGTLTPVPASVSFGQVPRGQQGTQSVDITNTGNLPMAISGFSAPTVPFGTPVPVTTGITLGPGDDAVLPVTFTPQSLGTVAGTYTLTASDGHNPAQKLTIPVTGTGTAPTSGIAIPSPGAGWTVNGSAQLTGTTLRLTPAVKGKSGSAVYYQPLVSDGLHATFTARIGGGSGADGLAFAMLDAAKATTTSLGPGADKLGFGGLPGVAVALDTYPSQSVGIVTGQTASGLVYAAKTTRVPNLRSGTHVIGVTVTGSSIAVTVDGKSAVTASVALPPTVLAAFTGGTGGLNDNHDVSGVTISSGAVMLPRPGGGWSYNGSAVMAGSDTRLTNAVNGQAGSVVYPAPVASNGLQVRFNEQIGGGTGADGMTFALLSPTTASTAHGSGGAGLGYAGLSGVAVAFDTHQMRGYPSSNFAGIATGASSTGVLKLTNAVNEIGQLRAGTHNVEITVTGGLLRVFFDGAQILAQHVTLPPTVKLAFTGATGGLNDVHAVRDAAISVGAPASSAGTVGPGRASAAPAATPTPPLPTVELVTSENFSEVLTDSAGMTLYRQIAPCSTKCVAQYHPLLVASGQQLNMPPLLPGRLGTVRLPDGSLQLTYNGARLFTYSGDHFSGDTSGVSLSWNVIQPIT